MNATQHPLVDGYLRSLEGAAKVLPRRERDELIGQIRSHLDEALTPESSEADVRNVLDTLGTPWDIVAAAGGQTTTVRRGAREVFALLLLVTGLPPVLGWVVGLGLLIWSPLWTPRQKWLGALVWPGGWLGVLLLLTVSTSASGGTDCFGSSTPSTTPAGTETCTTTGHAIGAWTWVPLLVVLIAAPFVVAGYLWRAAGRQSAG